MLRLSPVRFTENSGPLQPLRNRDIDINPGEHRSARVMMMAAFHVHLVGSEEGERCKFVVSVDESSKSAANFVKLLRSADDDGPREPDFTNPILVRPGERRVIDISDGQALHCHEIVLCHD